MASCDASTAPDHGTIGNCSDSLLSGNQCNPGCQGGYALTGYTSCQGGTIVASGDCIPLGCTGAAPSPANGRLGDCTTVTKWAHLASCDIECDTGYRKFAVVECVLGILKQGACVADHPRDTTSATIRGNVVQAEVLLAGVGVTDFTPSVREAFKRSIARWMGVDQQDVILLDIISTSRRQQQDSVLIQYIIRVPTIESGIELASRINVADNQDPSGQVLIVILVGEDSQFGAVGSVRHGDATVTDTAFDTADRMITAIEISALAAAGLVGIGTTAKFVRDRRKQSNVPDAPERRLKSPPRELSPSIEIPL